MPSGARALPMARAEQAFCGGGLVASDPVDRRLTAVLVADATGYSRLMGADEEGWLG